MIQQIAFAGVLGVAAFLVWKRIAVIRRNINLGKALKVSGSPERFRNLLLVAFGQKKMFKRPIAAILHLFIYVGFLVINIEVLEFMIDGFAGTHRIFSGLPFYGALMNVFEFLAVAVLVACLAMLFRRNVLRIKRLDMSELNGWPRLDANVILITEVVLMCAILVMNAADQLLQGLSATHYPATGKLYFSSLIIPLLDSQPETALVVVERIAWWFHILGILAFAVYITYSKHLHIALAFPNTYFANITSRGHMENMPVVTNEVRIMLGLSADSAAPAAEPGRFGARDVNDLAWNHLLAAYTCTECGRCTAECPANLTGKSLSPRKIMMDTRDRMEDVGKSLDKGGPGLKDGKTLLDNYITREEINACTACNACVEACPVLINPLSIILELRRYVAMEESAAPAAWNGMFQNIETSFSPWKFSPADRFNWADELKK